MCYRNKLLSIHEWRGFLNVWKLLDDFKNIRFSISLKKLIWSNNHSMLGRFRKWTMQLLKKYFLLIKSMKLLYSLFYVFKNVSSSISHKYSVFPKFRNFSKILYSTFNCLWTDFEKNLWMLTLRRHIFYIKWSRTLCYWLIEATNTAEHYDYFVSKNANIS